MTETTSHEVTFPLAWLAGLRLLAPKDGIRYYLNGVVISHGHLVVTDGTQLGAIADKRFHDLPELIIPNTTIDALLGLAKPLGKDIAVTLRWQARHGGQYGGDVGELELPGDPSPRLPFTAHTGKYPDWQRVLAPLADADAASGSPAPQFDWARLVKFDKAARLIGGKGVISSPARLYPRKGQQAAYLNFDGVPSFSGALATTRKFG